MSGAAPTAPAPKIPDLSISELLAAYGIRHEAQSGSTGRRYLLDGPEVVGLADAKEAVALLDVLDRVSARDALLAARAALDFVCRDSEETVILARAKISTALEPTRSRVKEAVPTDFETHNRLAPEILKSIIRTSSDETAAFILLESLVLGVMLFYRPDPRQAGEFLDHMGTRVLERLGEINAKHERGAAS